MDYTKLPKVQNLTESERAILDSMLKSVSKDGDFKAINDLWSVDYEEIPVSIDTFLEDDYYMGKVFQNGDLIYPFWREQLRYIFEENPDNAFEIIISGAIGCVTGDTKVRLLDNRILTIKEMAESEEKSFWLYSYDTVEDCWKPGLATNVHKSGIDTEVIQVNLSNDLSVKVTPNHPFLLTTGVYVEAKDLKPGDSIQSLYLYESESKFYSGYLCYGNEQPVHRHVAKCFSDVEFTKRINVHHKDHIKLNNSPNNLEVMYDSDHLKYHIEEYWNHEENHIKRSEITSERMKSYLSKLMSDARYNESWETSEERAQLSNRIVSYNKNEHLNLRKDITIERITEAARALGSTSTYKIAEMLQCSMTKVSNVISKHYKNKLEWITENDLPMNKIQESKLVNHTVLSIEAVSNEDVYDLTVDGYHNYGISDNDGNLIFTHNTGKSTVSAIGMMYLIYKTLCLRDPQKFYGLTANSPIVFVCLNLTLELAYNGLYSMIVEAIKLSPWFQDHVDIRGRYDFSIEFPKNLQLITASNVQHTIGKNVLGCLTGDTEVLTVDGLVKIKDLENKYSKFLTLSDDGKLETTVPAVVCETKKTSTILSIELENGSIIKCTPDHKFLTKSGVYKRADELSEDDDLVEVII